MADLLGQLGQSLSSFATTVTRDANAFVAGAQNSVAQLTGSGVNATGRVVGPLADHFGSDPVQFTLNAVKHFDGFMRNVATHVAERTGNAAFSVDTPKGKGSVPAKPAKSDTSAHVALVIALDAVHHPAELLEEAGRVAQGLPAKRGLDGDGFVWYPTVGIGGRGFFGIDEAAAGAAALAIIVAIAPALVTGLIAVVGAVAPAAIKSVTDVIAPKPPAPPPDNKIFGVDPIVLAVGAIALIGGAILLMRKRHAA